MKKKLIEFYLDWVNNFVTVEKMAEYYEMETPHVQRLIEIGKTYNEQLAKEPTIIELHTVQEIRKAVDEGKTVYSGNEAYTVQKNKFGNYNIICSLNGYCIGLSGLEGTQYENKLNGTNFYYKVNH